MGNTVVVKVGQLPGRIEEFAVEVGTTISALLDLASLDASGYDVKVDSVSVSALDSTVVTEDTKVVILARQVKGN
jgi:hypothetical protein